MPPVEFSGPPPANLADGIAGRRREIEQLQADLEDRKRQMMEANALTLGLNDERAAIFEQLATAMSAAAEIEAEAGIEDRAARRQELRYWLDRRRDAAIATGWTLAMIAGGVAMLRTMGEAIAQVHKAAGGTAPAIKSLAEAKVTARLRRFVIDLGLGALFVSGKTSEPQTTTNLEDIETEAMRPYELEP